MIKMLEPDKREAFLADQIISEVYLRNRTNAMLSLTLTVPRSSLQLDTVWWGVEIAPEAVGYAMVARNLTLGWIEYPVTAPVLLQGSGDTLVADKPIDLAATGMAGKRPAFYPHRNLSLWKSRLRQYKPAFESTVMLRPLSGKPDSIIVVVKIAPYDSLLLAQEQERPVEVTDPKNAEVGRPIDEATEETISFALLPRVQWTDSLQRAHRQYIILADIKNARAKKNITVSKKPSKSIYYLDFK
ncbi:hypothetical protein DNI29_09680 [Hymenobacter sediminis]|uniref:hypothetical protein n=1 Tax=Hymenobacter sediminis TaxID=2218621 RepID=UPI000F4D8C9B|nr:hypothetical protein [Hymenobacter sediminis]RPD47706.1 hypothetical protein DNI29_09680 [Hymenobacter sediminis]